MFAVIYRFTVHTGQDESFQEAWGELTNLIHRHEGSLGSRLHRESEGNYIAYAQWPDRQTWEGSGDKLPAEADGWRQQMRASCEKIETLHTLDMTDDLLQERTYLP